MQTYSAATTSNHGIAFAEVEEPLVLCVDDNEVILELLSETLTVSGFRVICECDSQRARRLIDSLGMDAVIVDYDMPGCNGVELANAIRREKPEVPILMFSGTMLPPEALRAVSTFVSKNQGVLALIEALRRDLHERAETCDREGPVFSELAFRESTS
jgi:CheY-like chemotaxis protein